MFYTATVEEAESLDVLNVHNGRYERDYISASATCMSRSPKKALEAARKKCQSILLGKANRRWAGMGGTPILRGEKLMLNGKIIHYIW